VDEVTSGQKDWVVRRAAELLQNWPEIEEHGTDDSSDLEDQNVLDSRITASSPDESEHSEAILRVLRDAESFLGRKAIMERADVPGSSWTKAIKGPQEWRVRHAARGKRRGRRMGPRRPLVSGVS
jgi:hypothetical protein